MLKLISIFMYFIRELVFDRKNEYNFKSSEFNARKFVVFSMIIASITLNGYLFFKILTLANHNVELKHKIHELELIVGDQINTIIRLDFELSSLGKNNNSPPLNEGNNVINGRKGK